MIQILGAAVGYLIADTLAVKLKNKIKLANDENPNNNEKETKNALDEKIITDGDNVNTDDVSG